MIDKYSNLLPATVIAAIFLFLLKEALEIIRHATGNNRKRKAFRILLREEIERNHWAFKSFFQIIQTIAAQKKNNPKTIFYAHYARDNRVSFRFKETVEDKYSSGAPIPTIREDQYNSLILELAMIDKKLYDLAQKAYTGIKELDHLRSSLLDYLNKEEKDLEMWFDGFLEYALSNEEDIYKAMNALYKECTGNRLEGHRLR